MKRLHAKSSLIGLLLSTMLFGGAFLVPSIASADSIYSYDTGTPNAGSLRLGNDVSCVAIPFTPSVNYTLDNVELAVRLSNNSSQVTVELWGDNAGTPASLIEAAPNLPYSADAGAVYDSVGSWITDNFAGSSQLNAGTKYWIVLALSSLDFSQIGLWINGTGGTTYYVDGYGHTCTSFTPADWQVYIRINGTVAGGGAGGGGGSYHFGSGGIPPAYTANFTTTTQQAAAVGAIGDINNFLWGYLPTLIGLMIALVVIGTGVTWLVVYINGRGSWNGLGDGLEDSGGGWVWDKQNADFAAAPRSKSIKDFSRNWFK